MTPPVLKERWRKCKSAGFRLEKNSTSRRTVTLILWGRPVKVYSNANFSIVSGQECNADCPFCVEKLRPASRGGRWAKPSLAQPEEYLASLDSTLNELKPLNPSVSITGGEPTLDPSLPDILNVVKHHSCRKLTLTTNGTGLFHVHGASRVIEMIVRAGARHLNISRACVDDARNLAVMRMPDGLDSRGLEEAIVYLKKHNVRPRLSCVLLDGVVDNMERIVEYLRFAHGLGADNVIFRELMRPDQATMSHDSPVAAFCAGDKTSLRPILRSISSSSDFRFVRQVMGYYYYVEVWNWKGMDVVFESADLRRIEIMKKTSPGIIHELVFHQNGQLGSTWQAVDAPLGPPPH